MASIDPEIYQRFVGLTKYGVEAFLCQITYKRLKIDPAKTRTDAFLKFVPSGVATVAELQGKGFAYLEVGGAAFRGADAPMPSVASARRGPGSIPMRWRTVPAKPARSSRRSPTRRG